jgi:tyrosinase
VILRLDLGWALIETDPIFYLHHGNLDRIFTQWQMKNFTQRLNEVGGPAVPFDCGGQNVTLDFMINIGRLAQNITLREALNFRSSALCYGYKSLES